jgi:ATP-binding cassette subfamily C protein
VGRFRASQGEIFQLARSLIEFDGRRTAIAILLMIGSGVVEGLSLAILVPLLTILTGTEESGFLSRMFLSALPAGASPATKLGFVLAAFLVGVAVRAWLVTLRDRKVALLDLEYGEGLQLRLFESLSRARWQDIEGMKHARITHALGTGMERVSSATQLLLVAAVSLAMLAAQWFITLLIAPAVAVIFLGIAAIGIVPFARILNRSFALGEQLSGGGVSLVHTTSQLLAGLKLSCAQNMQPAFMEEYSRMVGEQKSLSYTFLCRHSSVQGLLTLGAALTGSLLLFTGYMLGTAIPALLAAFAIFARMNAGAVTFIQCAVRLANNAPAYGQLRKLFEELEDGRQPPPPILKVLPAMRTIELAKVTVGAPGEERLSELDLVLRGGEVLGVTGTSGAGKTTLVDAITGLVAPDRGQVCHNGVPMDGAIGILWRDRISYVPQESFLLNDSIRKNLTWGGKTASDETLWEALAMAQMDVAVRRSPAGLDTQVGERGIRFSGGERQRIALARALLRCPEVLILDEATSAIDAETERRIVDRVTASRPGLTIVLVAHRPSTLALCDGIIRLEEGRLVEDTRVRAVSAVAR